MDVPSDRQGLEPSWPPDAPPPRRAVPLVVLVVLVLVVGTVVTRQRTAPQVLDLPLLGGVEPVVLADGRPAWLVRADDGSTGARDGAAHVVDAVAWETVIPGVPADRGIVELVGWCAVAHGFTAPHHGVAYTVGGQAVADTRPTRLHSLPANRTGLDLRSVSVDTTATGAVVQVGGHLTSPSHDQPIGLDGPPRTIPHACGARPAPSTSATETAGPADHAALAEALPARPRDGWHVTVGTLVIDEDGAGRWCDVPEATTSGGCERGADRPVALGISAEETGGQPAVLAGAMAVRVDDGAIVQVGVMSSTRWVGSSLRGAVAYDAAWRGVGVSVGVEFQPIGGVPTDCLRPVRDDPAIAIQPIGPDTTFDVAGLHDIDELAAAQDQLSGSQVRIVVDAATCEALTVRD